MDHLCFSSGRRTLTSSTFNIYVLYKCLRLWFHHVEVHEIEVLAVWWRYFSKTLMLLSLFCAATWNSTGRAVCMLNSSLFSITPVNKEMSTCVDILKGIFTIIRKWNAGVRITRMARLLCLYCFCCVAGDDHKPKTCVNMCIGMKRIVCIYCFLALLKA